ncbi:methyltransferase domain-containing protein [Candidatus Woesearchaeota archaeon]|nr:methyltransferase domain-containing protein [Candidatus Woesearchaeota archaeon]
MAYTKDFVYYYDLFKDEKSYVNTVNMLISLFKKHNVKSVLDIGCGTGKIDKLLKEKKYEILGIDNSKEMIEHAQRNYPEIVFKQMDAETFKLDNKFDAIIALDSVLTFLTKEGVFEEAIKNIVEHMKQGGILFFNTGFTEKLIPKDFTDHFFKEVEKEGINYKKEYSMKRQGNLLVTNIKIYENDKVIIEEDHIHRIISEDLVVKLLSELDCEVKLSGNSNEQGHQPLEVIAKKK